MATLYEIDKSIMECVDAETGEVTDFEALDSLMMQRREKIENIALYIKNLTSDAAAYKAEKESFAEKERAAQTKIERLKGYLSYALDGQKFSTERCAVNFRRTQRVDIVDMTAVPEEFLRRKETVEADKTRIKEAIKAGREISGCRLAENISPTIK